MRAGRQRGRQLRPAAIKRRGRAAELRDAHVRLVPDGEGFGNSCDPAPRVFCRSHRQHALDVHGAIGVQRARQGNVNQTAGRYQSLPGRQFASGTPPAPRAPPSSDSNRIQVRTGHREVGQDGGAPQHVAQVEIAVGDFQFAGLQSVHGEGQEGRLNWAPTDAASPSLISPLLIVPLPRDTGAKLILPL